MIDHGVDDAGVGARFVFVEPLRNDEEVHPTKRGKHEQKLGHELTPKVDLVSKVNCVHSFHEDSEDHVNNADNHSELGLSETVPSFCRN